MHSAWLLALVAVGLQTVLAARIPNDPYRPYIDSLEEDVGELDDKFDSDCATCQTEARRKLLRSLRCEAVLCDFESGNLCKWETAGAPGAPIEYIESFLKDNPDFAYYYAGSVQAAEANRPLRQLFMARARQRSRLRAKRQAGGLAEALAGIQNALAGAGAGAPGAVSPAEQAARDTLGPAFGQPGAEEAAKAAAALAKNNEVPTDYEALLAKIEADKTWGVFEGDFARHVTGLKEAAQGDKYAVTYVYPAEWAVMSVGADLHDDDYALRFEGFEHNNDVRMFVACDSPDRATLMTPVGGTTGERRVWQTYVAKCPKGTKRFLIVCENVSETKEGACGVDDIQLYTMKGSDYCQGVEPPPTPNKFKDPPAPKAAKEPEPGFIATVGPPPANAGQQGGLPNLPEGLPDSLSNLAPDDLLGKLQKAQQAQSVLDNLTGKPSPLSALGGNPLSALGGGSPLSALGGGSPLGALGGGSPLGALGGAGALGALGGKRK